MEFDGREGPITLGGQGLLVDTHAHLVDAAFEVDRDAVLSRAMSSGVTLIVAVGVDLESSRRSVGLARQVAGVVASVGIHPHDALAVSADALAELRQLAAEPRVVAIGETGLDYYRRLAPVDAQRRALEAHLGIADDLDKPVVIHDRDAHDDLLAILVPWARGRRAAGRRSHPGVLHCFSGDLAMAEKAVAAGFSIGFGGTLTYPRSDALAEVARRVDLDDIVLETDSPYLAPSPLRGRRNEPANIVHVAKRLAKLRGLTLEIAANRTSANARRLFGPA